MRSAGARAGAANLPNERGGDINGFTRTWGGLETLAVAVTYDGAAGEQATVKGRPLNIGVRRA